MVATFVSMLVAPSVAHIWGDGQGGIGGGIECLASLKGVHGCVEQIVASLLSAQFRMMESTCCRAFLDVDAKCWPQMFPYNPFFPPILKDYCFTQQPTDGDSQRDGDLN
ncbi:hypothetical protein ACSBR1_005555 [Camellia fascicularis]